MAGQSEKKSRSVVHNRRFAVRSDCQEISALSPLHGSCGQPFLFCRQMTHKLKHVDIPPEGASHSLSGYPIPQFAHQPPCCSTYSQPPPARRIAHARALPLVFTDPAPFFQDKGKNAKTPRSALATVHQLAKLILVSVRRLFFQPVSHCLICYVIFDCNFCRWNSFSM